MMFMNLRKHTKNQKGFTLVELMVVIAIIGVLAAIAAPRYASATATAHGSKVQADLLSIDTAIQMAAAQGHTVVVGPVSGDPSVVANMNNIPTPDCDSFRVGTVDYTGVTMIGPYQIIMDGEVKEGPPDPDGKPIAAVVGTPRAAIAATATGKTGPFTADKLGK